MCTLCVYETQVCEFQETQPGTIIKLQTQTTTACRAPLPKIPPPTIPCKLTLTVNRPLTVGSTTVTVCSPPAVHLVLLYSVPITRRGGSGLGPSQNRRRTPARTPRLPISLSAPVTSSEINFTSRRVHETKSRSARWRASPTPMPMPHAPNPLAASRLCTLALQRPFCRDVGASSRTTKTKHDRVCTQHHEHQEYVTHQQSTEFSNSHPSYFPPSPGQKHQGPSLPALRSRRPRGSVSRMGR